mmetsp:Transcript_40258/g.79118  ORF Transcript_40258/g.79118 Transcript_40258/m.79118 type:complete len:325 (-) Transcript_40258:120-1094(-)
MSSQNSPARVYFWEDNASSVFLTTYSLICCLSSLILPISYCIFPRWRRELNSPKHLLCAMSFCGVLGFSYMLPDTPRAWCGFQFFGLIVSFNVFSMYHGCTMIETWVVMSGAFRGESEQQCALLSLSQKWTKIRLVVYHSVVLLVTVVTVAYCFATSEYGSIYKTKQNAWCYHGNPTDMLIFGYLPRWIVMTINVIFTLKIYFLLRRATSVIRGTFVEVEETTGTPDPDLVEMTARTKQASWRYIIEGSVHVLLMTPASIRRFDYHLATPLEPVALVCNFLVKFVFAVLWISTDPTLRLCWLQLFRKIGGKCAKIKRVAAGSTV